MRYLWFFVYPKLILDIKQSIQHAKKWQTCNSGTKSVVVNFLKQELLLVPKIYAEGQNITILKAVGTWKRIH